jgi:capsular polysaccharide biosynthesis protein
LSEQVFDTRGVVRLLHRNRWRLASCTVVGAMAAAGFMVLRPPMYTATSLVLIPGPSTSATATGSPTGNDTTTDSAIATSASVLVPALAKVHPPISLAEGKQRVQAASTATNIVQITASGTSPQQAEALANAVAGQLISFVTSSGGATGTTALAGLEALATQLTKQVADFNQQIDTITTALKGPLSSSVSAQDTALLASLSTSQSSATLQLANVNSEIASAKLNAGIANVGTEVIQRATSASLPSLVDRGLVVVLGAAIGLVLGVALAFVRRRDPRLVSRDQIAEAVGVPVMLSSTVGRWRSTSNWLELLQRHQPETVERWNARKALYALGIAGSDPSHLTVISLIGDSASMAATCRTAIASASSGTRTSLVLTSDDESSVGLCNASDLLSARSEQARPNLEVLKGESPGEEADDGGAALTIISIVVDPDRPKLPAYVVRGTVVLAVSARAATALQIAQVLIFLGDEGLSVKGVFVTNPSDDDESTGRPLHAQRADEVVRLRTMGGLPPWPAVSEEQPPG